MAGCLTHGDRVVCYFPTESAMRQAGIFSAAPDLLEVLSAIVADYQALQRSQGSSASLGSDFTAGEWLGSRLGGHVARAALAIKAINQD